MQALRFETGSCGVGVAAASSASFCRALRGLHFFSGKPTGACTALGRVGLRSQEEYISGGASPWVGFFATARLVC